MNKIAVVGKGGKCEVCESLSNVRVVQVGANVIALCEECSDSLSKVISVDLLGQKYLPEEYRKPVCNFCGKVGEVDEEVKDVNGYIILKSCSRCEQRILGEED